MNDITVSNRFFTLGFYLICPMHPRLVSRYLYDNMPSQSVDNNVVLPQSQRRHYLFPKLIDVPLNLPYSSLVEIAAAFGEVIDRQLLRCGAVNVIGKGR